MTDLEIIRSETRAAMAELLEAAQLKPGALVVVGCSSSEIQGGRIGQNSAPEAAAAVYDAIAPILAERGLYLAAQCCEHLNRALVVERELAERRGYEEVCVRPMPKAGGSFAAAAFEGMRDPAVVEAVRAEAGLDIGGTLIGMHLKAVAVPLRLETRKIGEASVAAAKTRPKLIGGERAVYF
ncbi:MAG: TIGR01440 family protein [Firmicutes bacterium]|nr:TIGR01440 family protein [Bacillota bacterium]